MKSRSMILFTLAFTFISGQVMASQLLNNGNFETGTFPGWATSAVPGSSQAGFFIDTPGTTTPVSGTSTAPNPNGGNFYALTDQTGPGTYTLIQSFTVPVGAVFVTLSFDMFVNSYGGGPIIDPVGLNHTGPPNQHARVDILTASSTAFSTAAADVVANLYLGVGPFMNPNPYTAYAFDLSPILTAGTTYQLRFAEVDNQGGLNLGVDNVSISTSVPVPSAIALMGIGVVGFGLKRRKERNSKCK